MILDLYLDVKLVTMEFMDASGLVVLEQVSFTIARAR